MIFIYPYRTDLFSFFIFLLHNDAYFTNSWCYKKDDNQRTQAFENHYKQTGFTKENSYYSMKHKKEKKHLSKTKNQLKGQK